MKTIITSIVKFLAGMLCLMVMLPSSGLAAPIYANPFTSTEGRGNFIGDFNYTYESDQAATLVISLSNTTNEDSGFIAAFAFNNPDNLITGATLISSDTDFALLGAPDFQEGVNASKFGLFDIGVGIGSIFTAGKIPQQGVGVGSSETFTFALTGNHLDTLNFERFFNAFSSNTSNPEPFLVRYAGFNGGGSDMVPGSATNPVPEPATIILLGVGLLGMGVYIKKFR